MTSTNVISRILLCACLASSSLASKPWVVRFDGVGPVRVGMTLAQLDAILRDQPSRSAEEMQGCFYVESEKHPHLKFMVIDGHVARVDVEERGVSTSSGIQVGDSDKRPRRVYGSR